MKIAVLSDIHDNIHNIKLVLEDIKNRNIEKIIFLGDSNSPFIVEGMCQLQIPIIYIWGNNEGDEVRITQLIMNSHKDSIIASECFLSIEINNKKLFLTHFPELATIAFKSKEFDCIMFGHNHQRSIEKEGNRLLFNPGSIFANKEECSYAIYDTKSHEVEHIIIEDFLKPNP